MSTNSWERDFFRQPNESADPQAITMSADGAAKASPAIDAVKPPLTDENAADTLRRTQIELAEKALATIKDDLAAQEDAQSRIAQAISAGEADLALATEKAEVAKAEVEKISAMTEESQRQAQAAADASLEAAALAKFTAEKAEADAKALVAAQIILQESEANIANKATALDNTKQQALRVLDKLNEARSAQDIADNTLKSLKNENTAPQEAVAVKAKKSGRGFWHYVWLYTKVILIALAIAVVLRAYVFEITRTVGDSMLPVLKDGDNLITSKIHYLIGEPQRGDIITLDAPDVSDRHYIKRVIAVPGDTLTIIDGDVYVNGELVNEPYLYTAGTTGSINTVLANDTYFVMGDNRHESHDSRDPAVGAILKSAIRGKAVFRIYPFDDFGKLQ